MNFHGVLNIGSCLSFVVMTYCLRLISTVEQRGSLCVYTWKDLNVWESRVEPEVWVLMP
jgi:hypothetical protein